MQVLGLTGGIASGKSTAATALEAAGAVVIDADAIAHEVMAKTGTAYAGVVKAFGPDILDEEERIDRQKLGAKVFGNPNALQRLNHLVHPHVQDAMRQRLDTLKAQQNSAPVFLMIPLLYESDLVDWVEEVWVIYCTPEQQLQRLQTRNGFTEAEAQARLAAQWPIDIKKERADRVLDNTGGLEDLKLQIIEAMKGIRS